MDSWTKEQVEVCGVADPSLPCTDSSASKSMKSMGNIKSNAIYNPNELRHPPPPNLMDAERDSELEQYIRCE